MTNIFLNVFKKCRRIVIRFAAWVFIMLTAQALTDSINPQLFYSLSFIGFLIIVFMSGPSGMKPKWRANIDLAIYLGMVIFLIITAINVYSIVKGSMK